MEGEIRHRQSKGTNFQFQDKYKLWMITILNTTSLVAQMVKNLPTMQEIWVRSLGWKDPLQKGNPLQYSCLENSIDRGAWRVKSMGSRSQT